MRFEDKNQTLEAPANYTFRNAETDGAYIKLTYFQSVYRAGMTGICGENVITIYLNAQGREVGRCVGSVRFPQPAVEIVPILVPVGRWFRVKNGFLLALQGVKEMFSGE